MVAGAVIKTVCFKKQDAGFAGRSSNRFQKDEKSERDIEDREALLCRQCLQVVTHPSQRIAVQGSHRHTFANPAGILFQIGCFRSAEGCGCSGPSTEEWSWFRGYSWQVSLCRSCLTHLGWLYSGDGRQSFQGLILDRLVQAG